MLTITLTQIISALQAIGLHPGDWDQAAPICDKSTQDSRTLSAVRVALEQECRETVLASEFPSSQCFSQPSSFRM
jgi:hypothetical protein